jgi:hypothetical protein
MLGTKEFYEIMDVFERTALKYVTVGNSGFKRESAENFKRKWYYCDGNANIAFIIFLNGVSLEKH